MYEGLVGVQGKRKGTHWRMFGVDALTKGSVHCRHPTHMPELVPATKTRARWMPVGWARVAP